MQVPVTEFHCDITEKRLKLSVTERPSHYIKKILLDFAIVNITKNWPINLYEWFFSFSVFSISLWKLGDSSLGFPAGSEYLLA